MSEFCYQLKVPKDRIAVLIGKNGEIKKEIEETTNTSLKIDSKEGDVSVTGKDALSLFATREMITAIARGFNPDVAMLLLKPDYILDMIHLNDFAKNKNNLLRIKGRVIGAEGKSRKMIEELTETSICVYGKTIGIIGLPEGVAMARKAISSLLSGSPHSNVYKWLEKRRVMTKSMNFQEGMKR